MAGQDGLGSGDSESATQRHHTFANLDLARAGIARAQDDQFRPLQIQQRSFQTGNQAVFRERIRDLQRVVRAGQGDAASHQRVFPIVSWWGETPSSRELISGKRREVCA